MVRLNPLTLMRFFLNVCPRMTAVFFGDLQTIGCYLDEVTIRHIALASPWTLTCSGKSDGSISQCTT